MNDVNEHLHKLVKEYLPLCKNREEIAWKEAYMELVTDGVFDNFYKFGYRLGRYSYMYLFARCRVDGKYYTYLAAKYANSTTVCISEYHYFKNEVLKRLNKHKNKLPLFKAMIDGLNDLYSNIALAYFKSFVEKGITRARELSPVVSPGMVAHNLISQLDRLLKEFHVSDLHHLIEEDEVAYIHMLRCGNYRIGVRLSKSSTDFTFI